jgi:hypothetical protein
VTVHGWAKHLQQRPLNSFDQEGTEYRFFFTVDDYGFVNLHDFTVYVSRDTEWPPRRQLYEMTLEVVAGDVQTTYMDNHDLPEFRGKGISEALILEISKTLQMDVVSSATYRDMANRRSKHATVIWERLVGHGLATREEDRYRLSYPPKQGDKP